MRSRRPDLKLTVPQPESPPIRSVPADASYESPAPPPRPSVGGSGSDHTDGSVTPTCAKTSPFWSSGSPKRGSAVITPRPVAIDVPSPGSFDPLLEHFLRPLESSAGLCACVLERERSGKASRMLLEEGNVPLLAAKRRSHDFEVCSAEGGCIATLHRIARGSFSLRRASGSAALDIELCAIQLGEREVSDAPTRPRLNHMLLAAVRPRPPKSLSELFDAASLDGEAPARSPSLGADSPIPLARELGRPKGELHAALASASGTPQLLRLESRLPAWDETSQLLTLDYPPGRASLPSVQNFQLMWDEQIGHPPPPPPPPPGPAALAAGAGGDEEDDEAGAESLAYCACLVHGLMAEEGGVQTSSLDFQHPLSPLLAFAACLAAQDWT